MKSPSIRRRIYAPNTKTSQTNQLLLAAGQQMTKMAQVINKLTELQQATVLKTSQLERREAFYRVAEDLHRRGLQKIASVPDWVDAKMKGNEDPQTVLQIQLAAAQQRNLHS
jgi:hypothetical protein